jgi:hypothetical protein
MVKCPECRSDDLDLVERLRGDARILRCATCGHTWQRGEEPPQPSSGATGPVRRPVRTPTPAEVRGHQYRQDYLEALKHWSDEDDALSPIAPSLDNPYCIQPYDPSFFRPGTKGYVRECTAPGGHPSGIDTEPKWACKPQKPHWYAMCDHHMSQWRGWENRLRPEEREIVAFRDDDALYEEWTARQGGYVLVERSPDEYMLHIADCMHLERESDAIRITQNPRRWSRSRRPLEKWTELKTGGPPAYCGTCM